MRNLVDSIVRILTEHNLRVVRAFPGQQLPILAEPLAAVGTESRNTKWLSSNFFLTEQTVYVDLFVSYRIGAQRCEQAADLVERVLLDGITDYSILRVYRKELRHDAPSDCYRLRLCADVSSYEEGES